MTEYILRGEPTSAQLYLDELLAGVKGTREGRAGLPGLLLHCLRKNPEGIFMINAATGASFTNADILARACRVSRAIARTLPGMKSRARAASGVRAIVLLKNSEQFAGLYCGLLASAALPLLLDVQITLLELKSFLELFKPQLIFCEARASGEVGKALREAGQTADVIMVGDGGGEARGEGTTLEEFISNCGSEWGDDVLAEVSLSDAVLMVPTSGSTGLPKAVLLTHDGLIAQLPTLWLHHARFPRPEKRILLVSTAQWMTFTLVFTAAVVYQVPLVMTSQPVTEEHLLHIIDEYKPSWLLSSPQLAGALSSALSSRPLRPLSLRTLLLTGSPPPGDLNDVLKKHLQSQEGMSGGEDRVGGGVLNGYGMSEAHGFVAIPNHAAPPGSFGPICNIFQYKIIDENGKQCGPDEPGELYLKSDRVLFKGYYKNSLASEKVMCDGWYRSGDLVREDPKGNVFYERRLKFVFKYNNYQISPEEVETVVCGVAGVQQCVVGVASGGPAALVVAARQDDSLVDRIHAAVSVALSDYKRLRGGIALVPELPTTLSGKPSRELCQDLLDSLL